MTLKSTKLLVTGGAGFIGSNFVHYWIKNHPQDEITVLDKLTYAGNLQNLKDVADRIEFIKGDICDELIVDKAVAGISVLVHFAAESHVDRSITGPDEFIRTNILGTHQLLKAARKHNIKRFHHISTDEVFGMIPLDSNIRWTEETPYNPRSPYSASKAASDHLVRAYHTTYGLPITVTNCSNNFGPYMFPEKLIPAAITNLLQGKKIPIYTPGNQVRDWLYVEDHCSAIEAVLEKGKTGETYLIGGNHPEYTNLEVARLIVKIMGKTDDMIEMVGDRPGHDVKYAIDPAKITKELGWEPRMDFKKGLKETIRWYEDHPEYWKK